MNNFLRDQNSALEVNKKILSWYTLFSFQKKQQGLEPDSIIVRK